MIIKSGSLCKSGDEFIATFTENKFFNNTDLAQNDGLFSVGIFIAIDPSHVGK